MYNNPLIYTDPSGTKISGKGPGSGTWTSEFKEYVGELFNNEDVATPSWMGITQKVQELKGQRSYSCNELI